MRLLDRDAENEALARVLGAARTGSGGALLVEGPPGRDAAGAPLGLTMFRNQELFRGK